MGGVDVQTHVFLTSSLIGDEWSVYQAPAALPPGKEPLIPIG
jgi:hypothetical protein